MKIFTLMTVLKKEVICKMHMIKSYPGSNWNAIFHIKFWDQWGKKNQQTRVFTKYIGFCYGLVVGFVIVGLFFIVVLWYLLVTFFACLVFFGGRGVVCLFFLLDGF